MSILHRSGLPWVGMALLAALLVPIAWMSATAPRISAVLSANSLAPGGEEAFVADLSGFARWPYVVRAGWPYAVPGSTLFPSDVSVTEAGRPLEMRDDLPGAAGTYQISNGELRFSASDHSDPRTNGRAYTATFQTRLDPNLEVLGIVALLALSVSLASRNWLSSDGKAAIAYAIPMIACLCAFGASLAFRPLPVIYATDSRSYLLPALSLLSGDLTGVAPFGRIGYSALIAATLVFTTLRGLLVVQLAMSIIAATAVAWVLFLCLRAATSPVGRVSRHDPKVLRRIGLSAVGFLFVAIILSNNAFVFSTYSILTEAPHVALAALALLLFTYTWLAGRGSTRVPLAVGAFVVTYFSTLVRPGTLIALCLAGAALVWVLWAERSSLRNARNLGAVLLGGALIFSVYAVDKATAGAPSSYFGGQMLVCSHIPLVLPEIGEKTPQRAHLSAELRRILSRPHGGYFTLGYNATECFTDEDMNLAMQGVAENEGASRGGWLMRRFVAAVAHRPLLYARNVADQLRTYFRQPFADLYQSTEIGQEGIDRDWETLHAFASRVGVPRDGFAVRVTNPIPQNFPAIVDYVKYQVSSKSTPYFGVVVLSAMLLALVFLFAVPAGQRRDTEIVVLCVGTFVFSCILLVAMSFSFDVARYIMVLAPFALLWLAVSLIYVIYALSVRTPALFRKPGRIAAAEYSTAPSGRSF
jgi:hypothetical protein